MRKSTILGIVGLIMLTVVSYLKEGIIQALMWLVGGLILMVVSYGITRRSHELYDKNSD